MTKCWRFLLLPACLVLISCNQRNEALEKRVAQLELKLDSITGQRQSSATEVFHLRSECADLGFKILRSNPIGIGLTQSQVSHYDPKTNRCYVELIIQPANATGRGQVMERFLYDGQTGEMLATARIDGDSKAGMVFKRNIFTYDETISYIGDMMRDQ